MTAELLFQQRFHGAHALRAEITRLELLRRRPIRFLPRRGAERLGVNGLQGSPSPGLEAQGRARRKLVSESLVEVHAAAGVGGKPIGGRPILLQVGAENLVLFSHVAERRGDAPARIVVVNVGRRTHLSHLTVDAEQRDERVVFGPIEETLDLEPRAPRNADRRVAAREHVRVDALLIARGVHETLVVERVPVDAA